MLDEDDTFVDLRERAGDLSRMGVEHIWLIDPEKREAFSWEHKDKFWLPANRLEIAGTLIHLDLVWLWEQVSEAE